MNDLNIPAAKAVFDTHHVVLEKLEAANKAIHEAIVASMAYRDPLAPAIYGADMETLDRFAQTSKAKLNALFMTGVPIFSLRVCSPEFRAILEGSGTEDAMLRVLLESFPEKLPITSL